MDHKLTLAENQYMFLATRVRKFTSSLLIDILKKKKRNSISECSYVITQKADSKFTDSDVTLHRCRNNIFKHVGSSYNR